MLNQPELFPTEPPTNPLQEGFKSIFGGWITHNGTRERLYVAVFHNFAAYTAENPNWFQQVMRSIADQTKYQESYVLYISDLATGQTTHQGHIQ